ncbi:MULTISPECIES: ANTAR domain-containing protein [Catenuloplanes]|uniref:ANTAR domain-containing protein n=1 Tax=Catenuloplanes niger TaxID=587534 RepID=A0AAE3ZU55_9ACTN|nr:ANTAR domain-containing protein [Catenuloplanes niger]MDR7324815.1 hypothetical protein [Catenuloplanes niger]
MGLPGRQRTPGALNFYGTGDRRSTTRQRTSTVLFAGHAAVFVANAAAYEQSVELAAQMRRAMASRAVIEQAEGIVMVNDGCTPAEAFNTLVAMSTRADVKLREVAQRLVDEARKRR